MLRVSGGKLPPEFAVQLAAGDLQVNPGGGEIQAAATHRALRDLGIDARLTAVNDDGASLAGLACLHLFGSRRSLMETVRRAKQRRVRTLLSPIAWLDIGARWHETGPVWRRLISAGSLATRRALPWLPDWRRRLYHAVDMLLPNSRAEADQLEQFLGVPRERIRVVPNGADERFAHASADLFYETYGIRDFVLYAGRIEPRKNQLGFLKAMRGLGMPVVVLGDAVPQYRWYYDRCRATADSNVHFLPRFAHRSSLLASAYAACRCLALTSWFETPGLVALEAGMSGTPLVLTCRGAAPEYFGDLATYVDPRSLADIRAAVRRAFDQSRSHPLQRHVRTHYTWLATARATAEAYQSVA